MNQKLSAPNKNLSNILSKLSSNTNNKIVSQTPTENTMKPPSNPTSQAKNTSVSVPPPPAQPKITPPLVNDSPFRRSLRINSARLAHSLNKSKSKPEISPSESDHLDIKQEKEDQITNMNEIIDAFAMKENEQQFAEERNDEYAINNNFNEDDDQWETFNEATNQQFSDDSANDMANTQSNTLNNDFNKGRIRKFSDRVRNELERSFLANNFITGGEKKVLATRLNLTERQVSKWFVHRREKLRRLEKRASNINSTLQEHYRSQQSNQTNNQPIYNEEYINHDQNDINNDEYYNDEEENWFNDLQETNENRQHGNIDYNNGDDYNECVNEEYDENNYDYQSSNETNSNSDEPHQNYSSQTNANNKRYSLDTHSSNANKRVCLNLTTNDLDDYSNKPQRRLFPPHVISHLESIFDNEKYLKDDQVAQISRETNLSEKQIRSWFKQRRYRYNQENKQNGIDIEIKKYNNLSQNVINELETAFTKNNYVYGNDKKILARKLNLTPVQLERWFYYRRKKQSNGSMDVTSIANETF